MFLSKNKRNNVYPVNPRFTVLKWGLRGSKLYWYIVVMSSGEGGDGDGSIFIIIVLIVVVAGIRNFIISVIKGLFLGYF